MKLTLVRHTKVAVEPGICYGYSDVQLAGSYPEELELVRQKLETLRFDQVISSPLNRCKTLATDLFPDQPVLFENRLKELNFGLWENKSWDAIYKTLAGRHWMDNYLEIPCLGGESYPQFRGRVTSFLNDLKSFPFKNPVAFTHGGVIRMVKSILEDQPMDDVFATFSPAFGGVYEFEIE